MYMRIFNTSSRLGQYHSLTQVLTQYQYQFQYQKCSIPILKISSIEFPGRFISIKRNLPNNLSTSQKASVYVLYIRPLILYGTTVWFANRTNLEKLESFQSTVTRWITSYDTYKKRPIQRNILPLSLLFQLEDLLTFNKVLNGKLGPEVRSLIEPSKAPRQNLRETGFQPFKLQKTKLKLTDSNFIHRATRLANFVPMKHNKFL